MSHRPSLVRHLLTLVICVLALTPAVCNAQSAGRAQAGWTWRSRPEGNVCGLYAVARAFDILGRPVPIESLWRPEFMASGEGSTPDELRKAIDKHGGYSVVASGLTGFELRALQLPFIANTRASADDPLFNHWVCVQPSNFSVTVFDGADKGQPLSYSEFLAKWNGVGIVVSDKKYVFLVVYILRMLGFSLLVFVPYVAMRLLSQIFSRKASHAARAVVAVLSSVFVLLLVAPLLFGFSPIGSQHRYAVNVALLPAQPARFRNASLDELVTAAGDLKILLVDARLPEDYVTGTIGNAVNIPPFAEVQEIGEFLGGIEKTRQIVVFCQSESCEYSGIVAKKVCHLGFQNVAVSLAGYTEYWEQPR